MQSKNFHFTFFHHHFYYIQSSTYPFVLFPTDFLIPPQMIFFHSSLICLGVLHQSSNDTMWYNSR